VIDVEVEVDGEVIESETQKAMEAELKEGILLPELLAVLPGTFVDETREQKVTFPRRTRIQSWRARTRRSGSLAWVKEKILPPLDDALAKILSEGKHETVESYRESIRQELEESVRAMEKLEREQESFGRWSMRHRSRCRRHWSTASSPASWRPWSAP